MFYVFVIRFDVMGNFEKKIENYTRPQEEGDKRPG
jgi:hypothetical protein